MPKPNADPLQWNAPIVDPETGFPSAWFMRQFGVQRENAAELSALFGIEFIAGVGLGGGGTLGDLNNITINLEDTAVTPNTYGDASNVPQFTVDQQGRITGVTEVPIAASGTAWTVAATWDHAVAGNTASPIDFIGLAGANEILVIMNEVTKSVSGVVDLQVSVNNGSSFFSTNGDYVSLAASGIDVNATGISLHVTASAAARTGAVHIVNANGGGIAFATSSGDQEGFLFRASTSAIDALRVIAPSGGNFTGGTITVFTR